MEDEPTPGWALAKFWEWFPVWAVMLIVVVMVGGGLTYAGHVFGWWLGAQDATHQAQITQNGYANQTSLREQIQNQFQTVTSETVQIAQAKNDPGMVAAIKPQREASANMICADAQEITGTPLPAQEAQWVTVNCLDGTVSMHSPIYTPGWAG